MRLTYQQNENVQSCLMAGFQKTAKVKTYWFGVLFFNRKPMLSS